MLHTSWRSIIVWGIVSVIQGVIALTLNHWSMWPMWALAIISFIVFNVKIYKKLDELEKEDIGRKAINNLDAAVEEWTQYRAHLLVSAIGTAILLLIAIFTQTVFVYLMTLVSLLIFVHRLASPPKN
jgi:hypothetical protein